MKSNVIPVKTKKILIQARVAVEDVEILRDHNVDIPELIRQIIFDTASDLLDKAPNKKRSAK